MSEIRNEFQLRYLDTIIIRSKMMELSYDGGFMADEGYERLYRTLVYVVNEKRKLYKKLDDEA